MIPEQSTDLEISKKNELAKRTAMFTIAGQVGKMFAGAMMAAIHETMDGHAGLQGWQWVLLIDGIITCPVAIFGYFLFPDLPENTKAPYLDEKERQLALDRLPPKREDGHNIQPWSLAKRVLGQPLLYVFVTLTIARKTLAYQITVISSAFTLLYPQPCRATSSRVLCSST